MIPDKSIGSFSKGIWFVHKDGEQIIHVWGSFFTGKEKIFLNSKLVSEQRSLKMTSGHVFKSENGAVYEVEFSIQSLLKGSPKCVIKKENVILKTYRARFQVWKFFTLKRTLTILGIAIALGVLKGIFKFSELIIAIFIGAFLMFYLFSANSALVIEEDSPAIGN